MNVERMSQEAAALYGDVLWISLKEGQATVRVVSRPGEEDPWRKIYRHFLQDHVKTDDFPRAPICLEDSSCPGCMFAEKARVEGLRESGSERDANRLKGQRRYVWVAFSRENPADEEGNLALKLLECPTTVFLEMMDVANEWGDFTDPETGFDLVIKRSAGAGIPKYDVSAATKREGNTRTVIYSPLTEEEKGLIENDYPDLDEILRRPNRARFALALGLPVEEPLVQPGVVPTVPPTAPSTVPAVSSKSAPVCPYYGTQFDPADEACRECGVAEQCSKESEAKAPRRKPVA